MERDEFGSVKLYVNENLSKILVGVAAAVLVAAILGVWSNIQEIRENIVSLKTQVGRMDKQVDQQSVQLMALMESLKDAEIRWLTRGGSAERR